MPKRLVSIKCRVTSITIEQAFKMPTAHEQAVDSPLSTVAEISESPSIGELEPIDVEDIRQDLRLIIARLTAIDQRMNLLENAFIHLNQRLDNELQQINTRLDSFERRLTVIENEIQNMK
jgi:hypothetical protein